MRFELDTAAKDETDQDLQSLVAEVSRRVSAEHKLPFGAVEAAFLKVAVHSAPEFRFGVLPRGNLRIIEEELATAALSGKARLHEALEEITANTSETMRRISTVRWVCYRGLPLFDRSRLYTLLAAPSASHGKAVGIQRRQSYWPGPEFERSFSGPLAARWPELFMLLAKRSRSRKGFEKIAVEVIREALAEVEPEIIKKGLRAEARRLSSARGFIGEGADLVGFGPFAMLLTALWIAFELRSGAYAGAAKSIEKNGLFYEKPRFGVCLKVEHYFALSKPDADRLVLVLRRLQRSLRPLLDAKSKVCAEQLGWSPFLASAVSSAGDVRGLGSVDLFSSTTLETLLGCNPPTWWVMCPRASSDAVSWARDGSVPNEQYFLTIVGLSERFGPFTPLARLVVENVFSLPPDSEFSFKDVTANAGSSYKKRDIFSRNEQAADALFEHVGGRQSRFRLRPLIQKALVRGLALKPGIDFSPLAPGRIRR
jgi:hypothetical protein